MAGKYRSGELRIAWCEINAVGHRAQQYMIPAGDFFMILDDGYGKIWIAALTRFGVVELHAVEVSCLTKPV